MAHREARERRPHIYVSVLDLEPGHFQKEQQLRHL